MSNPLDDVPVTLVIRADRVNYLMNLLAQQPYAHVADLIALIKTQGDACMDAARAAAVSSQITEGRA